MKVCKKKLLTVIVLGLLIRLALLFADFSFDVNNHISWAQDALVRGLVGFFETPSKEVYATLYPNYPPLAIFLFYPLPLLKDAIFSILWKLNISIPLFPSFIIPFTSSRAFLAGIFKLPAVLADLGLAWVCLLYARRLFPKKPKVAEFAFAAIFLNPAFFYNSAYWGQIDVIPLFLFVYGLYTALFLKRAILSALLVGMSLLVKPTAIVFLPIYIGAYIHQYGIRKFFWAFAAILALTYAAFFPFFKSGDFIMYPFATYVHKILETQSLGFVTNNAFNLWGVSPVLTKTPDTALFLFGAPFRFWGWLISASLAIYYLTRIKKAAFSTLSVFTALYMTALTVFIFATKMHERYLILPLPFLLLASLSLPSMKKWFYLLSLANLVNLYGSWPVPPIAPLMSAYAHLATKPLLSLINVVFFVALFRKNFFVTSKK